MADAYSIAGTLWPLLLMAAAFALVFVLRKACVIESDESVESFSKWSSAMIAALVAVAADTGNSGALANLLGRAAIFAIVWFVGAIFITLGASMATGKAKK